MPGCIPCRGHPWAPWTEYSFDRTVPAHVNRLPDAEPPARSFALVIADQVFPYLRHRCELDAIEALVMPHGLLGLQLPLPREVPAEQDAADPTWAQCAFYPWESLRRLMLQWGRPAVGRLLVAVQAQRRRVRGDDPHQPARRRRLPASCR
ncbi:hypothetical protein, partial [Xanthomonas oryzae]|uniref:hypothetical protein n=2 Tax=Xanthomonas oryzae TaxID=347 RepID=UPI001C6857E9